MKKEKYWGTIPGNTFGSTDDYEMEPAGKLVCFGGDKKGKRNNLKIVFQDLSKSFAEYLLFHHRVERVANGIKSYPTGIINNSEVSFNRQTKRNESRDYYSYDVCLELDTRTGGTNGTIVEEHIGNLLAKVCRICAGDEDLPALEKNTQGERYAENEDLSIFQSSEVNHNDQKPELVF